MMMGLGMRKTPRVPDLKGLWCYIYLTLGLFHAFGSSVSRHILLAVVVVIAVVNFKGKEAFDDRDGKQV